MESCAVVGVAFSILASRYQPRGIWTLAVYYGLMPLLLIKATQRIEVFSSSSFSFFLANNRGLSLLKESANQVDKFSWHLRKRFVIDMYLYFSSLIPFTLFTTHEAQGHRSILKNPRPKFETEMGEEERSVCMWIVKGTKTKDIDHCLGWEWWYGKQVLLPQIIVSSSCTSINNELSTMCGIDLLDCSIILLKCEQIRWYLHFFRGSNTSHLTDRCEFYYICYSYLLSFLVILKPLADLLVLEAYIQVIRWVEATVRSRRQLVWGTWRSKNRQKVPLRPSGPASYTFLSIWVSWLLL